MYSVFFVDISNKKVILCKKKDVFCTFLCAKIVKNRGGLLKNNAKYLKNLQKKGIFIIA